MTDSVAQVQSDYRAVIESLSIANAILFEIIRSLIRRRGSSEEWFT
jgi:hypothetical protein